MPYLALNDTRGPGGQRNHYRRFLGFHLLAGDEQHRTFFVQPAPLESNEVAPAQAGVEAHQDDLAQPGGRDGDQACLFLIGKPAKPLLALLIQRYATEGGRGHPVPATWP